MGTFLLRPLQARVRAIQPASRLQQLVNSHHLPLRYLSPASYFFKLVFFACFASLAQFFNLFLPQISSHHADIAQDRGARSDRTQIKARPASARAIIGHRCLFPLERESRSPPPTSAVLLCFYKYTFCHSFIDYMSEIPPNIGRRLCSIQP